MHGGKKHIILISIFILLLSKGCIDGFISDKPYIIAEISVDEGKILIYKSPSNATVQESIQIRTSDDTVNSKRIFMRYDILQEYKLSNDSLELILQDTSGFNVKTDTFTVEIESLIRKKY